jgi:hypothetical protein
VSFADVTSDGCRETEEDIWTGENRKETGKETFDEI